MKKVLCILLALLFAMALPLCAAAAPEYDESIYRIVDYSDILTLEEINELDEKICQAVERYYCDFPVLIIDGTDFLQEDETLEGFVEELYDDCRFGVGEGLDGAMLVADVDYGSLGIYTRGYITQLLTDDAADRVYAAYDDERNETLYQCIDVYLDAVFAEAEALGLGPDMDAGSREALTGDQFVPQIPDQFVPFHDPQAPRVVDGADLFSDSEEQLLSRRIAEMGQRYSNDFVIVTVNDTYERSHMEYADDYFDYNGYGLGPDYDGMLLLICMNSNHRGWYISTHAECLRRFSDSDIDYLGDSIKPYLSDGEYYRAAEKYLDKIAEVFDRPENYYVKKKMQGAIFPSIIVAAVIALIVLGMMRGSMKTARTAQNAAVYLVKDSFYLRRESDTFLNSHVTRTRRSSSSSSGGSSHRSSSGRSHGGGGGSF